MRRDGRSASALTAAKASQAKSYLVSQCQSNPSSSQSGPSPADSARPAPFPRPSRCQH